MSPARPRSYPRAAGRINPLAMVGVMAVLLVACMIIGFLGMMQRRAAPTGPPGGAEHSVEPDPSLYASMVIPEFTLVDQDGAPRGRSVFLGRHTILAFTFTNCPTVCPIMHSHMIRLQEVLRTTPVRMLSISVDPANDTPEALRAYGRRLGVDHALWTFLTGDMDQVRAVLDGLRLGIEDDPSITVTLDDGRVINNILHPSRFLLIGPDGSVLAMESGVEWAGAQRLARLAVRLAARAGE